MSFGDSTNLLIGKQKKRLLEAKTNEDMDSLVSGKRPCCRRMTFHLSPAERGPGGPRLTVGARSPRKKRICGKDDSSGMG